MTAPELAVEQTSVYRWFTDSGELLYVGMTKNVNARSAHHRASAEWWPLAKRLTVEFYDSREEAAAAELAAINTERPQHNVVGVNGRTAGRTKEVVSDAMLAELVEAQEGRNDAYRHLKLTVRRAVKESSVRSVATALGVSPTTVQKWVHEDN